jgi:mannose-6-phosphate isomerase-like protein (cupin superfamily)
VGSDDNFMLSFLGEDDPGHVTWANDVIEGAASYGLYLRKDSSLIDVNAGDPLPPPEELLQPLSKRELLRYNRTSPLEMAARIYNVDRFDGDPAAFADCALPGGAKRYHAIIGEGCHELEASPAHILNPHSFSLGALVTDPGEGWLTHRYGVKQVLVVGEGEWEIRLGRGAMDSFTVGPEDTVSVPAGYWRSARNAGSGRGVLYVATAGDLHADIEWAPQVAAQLADR